MTRWWLFLILLHPTFWAVSNGLQGSQSLWSSSLRSAQSLARVAAAQEEGRPEPLTLMRAEMKASSRAIVLALGLALSPSSSASLTPPPPPTPLVSLYDAVMDIVEQRYESASVNRPALDEAAVSAALAALGDPYSELLPQRTAKGGLLLSLAGRQAPRNIGLAVVKDSRTPGLLTVVNVAARSAAESAGIRVGDRIAAVDSEPIDTTRPLLELVDRIAGASRDTNDQGTLLSIQRDGMPGSINLRLPGVDDDRRRPSAAPSLSLAVALPSKSAPVNDNNSPRSSLVYLRLDAFGPRAGDEILAALMSAADDETAPILNGIGGVILDLRSNPGGLLDAAVDVASLFLPNDIEVAGIVPSDSRNAVKPQKVKTAGGAVIPPSVPIVCLLNGESRSAAEVVAAALQEHDRGLVVATDRSFGKASVQQIFQIEAGGAPRDVKLTTARYVTPSGRFLDGANGGQPGGVPVFRSDLGRVVATRQTVGVVPDLRPSVSVGTLLSEDVGTAQTPEALLVKSGAFFDFASEFCRSHPSLVAQASSLSPEGPGNADLSRSLRDALSDDARLLKDLRAFISSDPEKFKRSSALGFLDSAEASSSSSSSSSSSAALIAKARVEIRRELLQTMSDDPRQRAKVVARTKDSIRARFLSEDERRRATFEDELRAKGGSLLSFAFQLVDEKKAMYEAAMSTSPLKVNGEDEEGRGLADAVTANKKKRQPVAGFESEGQCLPLQQCNEEEYVYLGSL